MEETEAVLLRERRFLLAFFIVSGLAVLYVTRAYLGWAVLGLVAAYVTAPWHRKLSRLLKSRGRAAVVIVATIVLGVALPLVALGWSIASDVANLASALNDQGLPRLIETFLSRVVSPEVATSVSAALAEHIQAFGLRLAPELVDLALNAGLGIFIMGSALLSMLLKGEQVMDWVKRLLPLRPDREDELFDEIGRAVDAVMYGIVVVAAIQALAGGILWWIAGMPSPVFWTVVMFVLSAIPIAGPFLVIGPAAIWSYLNGDLYAALVLGFGGFFLVGMIDNLLRPMLIGKKGGLDPTLVLVSIVGGMAALGPVGIVAGPLVVALFLHVAHLVVESRDSFGGDFPVRAPKPPTGPDKGPVEVTATPDEDETVPAEPKAPRA